MTAQKIDLTAGDTRVVGNRDDTHLFRLSNPIDQDLIATGGEYDAEFTSSNGTTTEVVLDKTSIGIGLLILPVTILSGVYRVRRLNPRRTIAKISVEIQ